jgi:WD40 repeat protein
MRHQLPALLLLILLSNFLVAQPPILHTTGHTATITCMQYSPDGYTLASTGRDSLIQLWDLASGKLLYTIRAHRAKINTIAFSPDGRCLATGGADRAVWLHILDEEENSKSVLIDQKNPQGIYGLQFSPNGQLLASSSLMGELKLWNLKKRGRPQIKNKTLCP